MEMKARQSGRRSRTAIASACVDAEATVRPMRTLLLHLRQAEPSLYGRERIRQHAETSMRVIQLGLGAIGHLLARSAVHVENESIPSECMESLGMLMAELSDMAAVCYQLSSEGRGAARSEGLLQEPRK